MRGAAAVGLLLVLGFALPLRVRAWQVTLDSDDLLGDNPAALAFGQSGELLAGSHALDGYRYPWVIHSLDMASGSVRWRKNIYTGIEYLFDVGFGAMERIAVRSDGAAFMFASYRSDDTYTSFEPELHVRRLAPESGADVWQHAVRSSEQDRPGRADQMIFAANGDAIVGGSVRDGHRTRDLVVARLDPETGAERWKTEFDGLPVDDSHVNGLVETPDGAVVVLASQRSEFARVEFLARLVGDSGAPVWMRDLGEGSGHLDPGGLGLLPGGDLVVAGSFDALADPAGSEVDSEIVVTRHSMVSGEPVWTRRIGAGTGGSDTAHALAVAEGGEIFVAAGLAVGASGSDYALVSLASDGAVRWSSRVVSPDGGAGDGEAFRVELTGSGDPLVLGTLGSEAWAVRFDADTGAERWRRRASDLPWERIRRNPSRSTCSYIATSEDGFAAISGCDARHYVVTLVCAGSGSDVETPAAVSADLEELRADLARGAAPAGELGAHCDVAPATQGCDIADAVRLERIARGAEGWVCPEKRT